jgi:hypothetical protein
MNTAVPPQQKGASSATTYTVKALNADAAALLFQKARKNLLNPGSWHKLAGPSSAIFTVVNNQGHATNVEVKEGNYLRISIPTVPGRPAGDGYDWVSVENIVEKYLPGHQYVAISVRPAVPPFYKNKEIAHFFAPDATSTFYIEIKGRRVKAAVYGRNERPNTKVHGLFSKLRNLFVALGAMLGLNKPQWKSLVKGWLSKSG